LFRFRNRSVRRHGIYHRRCNDYIDFVAQRFAPTNRQESAMNRARLLTAVALAVAVSAPALAATDGATSSHAYAKTRAEVRAELMQAQHDGSLAHMNATSYTQGIDLMPFSPRNHARPEGAAR
jgi:hypothetical protein